MSTISKNLLGFLYNGVTLALASAPWKNNVSAIYGFNAAGTGYRVFKPGNSFNSLTQLEQDGSYIVASNVTGYDLPGASLAVVASVATGPGPLSIAQVEVVTDAGTSIVNAACNSTDPTDMFLLMSIDGLMGNTSVVGANSADAVSFPELSSGTSYTLRVVNRYGNMVTRSFVAP